MSSDSKIKVKFFARYAEEFGIDETELSWNSEMRVQSIWLELTKQTVIPANLLCAVNMEYCKLSDKVEQGDEVAFFPPVSGG